MAEDSDKTEEPTEHKLQEARKKGQIFKSQDVISTLMLVTTCAIVAFLGSWMVLQISGFAKTIYGMVPYQDAFKNNAFRNILYMTLLFGMILLPLMAAAFIMAIVSNLAQIKFIFSAEPLNPKLSKINPIEGFKRIFSMKSLMELFKQLAKLIIVSLVCYSIVKKEIVNFKDFTLMDINMTLYFLKKISVKIVSYVLIAMTAIAAIDYLFQRQQFMKQMRMSIQELKDEYKDTEGNPQVKSKIRQLMRQNAMGRMMEEVPDASAVITNPTHLAVAIKYEPGVTKAPVVVAKGERLVAVQIKTIAQDNDVPIIENVELARVLFSACEIGQSIPVELYKAVAEVLAFIIKLKKKKERRSLLRKQ